MFSTIKRLLAFLSFPSSPPPHPQQHQQQHQQHQQQESPTMYVKDPKPDVQVTTIQSKGIYHGLPVLPDSLKGLSAIVAGSNGMSGDHMVRVLSESPQRWTNIYTISRRAPEADRKVGAGGANVKHITADFLSSSPEQLGRLLLEKGIKAIGALLSNFLGALKFASIKPKRFMLQTGAKHYGLHLGTTKTPQAESDPRVNIEPNFYYDQEDILFKYCKETGVEWNIVRPSFILGAVKNAAMNLAYGLGVFAAVNAHLGRPLAFPGNIASWDVVRDMSSAMLNGYMEEWAVLNPKTPNEVFNACDNSATTPGSLWTQLANLYRVKYTTPAENGEYKSMTMPCPPPRGFGPPEEIHFSYALVMWSYDPQVHAAWKELAQKHHLVQDPFATPADRNRIFGFTDTALLGGTPVQFSMDKSRKFGWNGNVDSSESLRKVLQELVEMKMLPPLPKPK
ncbi:hypothetical protein FQN53_000445 [Emmonsiellopsis sp. PD_33]|nr:hypothetical protein FQN53_000445 [Emmonsiellopsis sp. PD_33]